MPQVWYCSHVMSAWASTTTSLPCQLKLAIQLGSPAAPTPHRAVRRHQGSRAPRGSPGCRRPAACLPTRRAVDGSLVDVIPHPQANQPQAAPPPSTGQCQAERLRRPIPPLQFSVGGFELFELRPLRPCRSASTSHVASPSIGAPPAAPPSWRPPRTASLARQPSHGRQAPLPVVRASAWPSRCQRRHPESPRPGWRHGQHRQDNAAIDTWMVPQFQGCGYCFGTSPNPSERGQSAGDPHSKPVFKTPCMPLGLHLSTLSPSTIRSSTRAGF